MLTIFWKRDEKWNEMAEKLYERCAAISTVGSGDDKTARLQIVHACTELLAMLLFKNMRYGNSALDGEAVFAKHLSPADGIKVRLDDKLRRLKNDQAGEDEDVILDLLGYLVLLRIAKRPTEDFSRYPLRPRSLSEQIASSEAPEAIGLANPVVVESVRAQAEAAISRMNTTGPAKGTVEVRREASRVPSMLQRLLKDAVASHGVETVRQALENVINRDEAVAVPAVNDE